MLHKDLTGLDLHIPKLHAPTHLVGGTDPLGLAESEITGLVTDLSGKAPTAHSHVKADITDFPSLGTAAVLNVDADIATLALPANTTISAAGAELINDADAAAQLVTLGTAAYSEGTWTPVLNSFTIVGSAPAAAGAYRRIGKLVFVTCTIQAGSGGNTSVACSGGNISGLLVNVSGYASCTGCNPGSGAFLGQGMVAPNAIYPAAFTAQTVGPLSFVATYCS